MQERVYQASAPATQLLTPEAFATRPDTAVYWLGSAGILINSRGTLVMIDPVIAHSQNVPELSETERALLVLLPIEAGDVPRLDALLYTHSDCDHLGHLSAAQLQDVCPAYHATAHVAGTLSSLGIAPEKITAHKIGETFYIKNLKVTLTVAHHSWQKSRPDLYDWWYGPEDCCGFVVETPDGTLWAPGDSVLLKEHLQMKGIDLLFIDFSEDPYHFGLENAVRLANTLDDAELIVYHFGTYDAPDKLCFNADPQKAADKIKRPERLHLLAPGAQYLLKRRIN